MAYYRKKPIAIEAFQWWRNGDHPRDYDKPQPYSMQGEEVMVQPAELKRKNAEGGVVRLYRRPDVRGDQRCAECGGVMAIHGWIDTKEGGHRVCPSDWIVRGTAMEYYPVKDAIFLATYDMVPDDDPEVPALKDKYEKEAKP